METSRSNNSYHRQDVKIPINTYERICDIAQNKYNEPIHHRSNKPIISDTLIKLIELGIQAVDEGKEAIPINNTDNYTDTKLIKKLIDEAVREHLENHHTSSITNTDNLTDNYTDSYTDTQKEEVKRTLEVNTDNYTDTIPMFESEDENEFMIDANNSEVSPLLNDSYPNDKETPQANLDIVLSENKEGNDQADLDTSSEVIETQVESREKTFIDTTMMVNTWHSEGKTDGQIVRLLNDGFYPTKKGITKKWKTNQVRDALKKSKQEAIKKIS